MFARLASWLLLAALAVAFALWTLPAGRRPATTESLLSAHGEPLTFNDHVRPRFEAYCLGCHGEKKRGGLDLRPYRDRADVLASRRVFENVLKQVSGGLMPPEGKPQPTAAERRELLTWLESELFFCDCRRPDPGHVTVRRLNRVEYNHTIRDLTGLDLHPADDFPPDDTGYGFDNIGDVLSIPPVLFERYLAAAQRVADRLVFTNAPSAAGHANVWTLPASDASADVRGELARRQLGEFAFRAFRRPVAPGELDRLLGFYRDAAAAGDAFDVAVRHAVVAVLVSPQFLFRGEPGAAHAPGPVWLDEFALASRLSYFLWSSMPDEELRSLASAGRLRRHLDAQVRRMLRDPKSQAFVENFAGQWLQLRKLDEVQPDAAEFPAFSPTLRTSMRLETERFFERILREDRSVLDFIAADWTYVDAPLARHYGLTPGAGDGLQLVSLQGSPRGGLLGQAAILTLTSNPTRTSPVKRGKWVLENLLGTPPPPPPPNVPLLNESKQARLTGSLRQRMEQHRADPACANCHALMDPIGFGLENYDGVGTWRTKDGEFAIEPAGRLADGTAFAGATELRQILLTSRREEFLRCLASKLLTYALGRGLEYYDRCAVDEITRALGRGEYRFSAAILAVVNSVPFQMQRGAEPAVAAR